jgi:hypothetical protein
MRAGPEPISRGIDRLEAAVPEFGGFAGRLTSAIRLLRLARSMCPMRFDSLLCCVRTGWPWGVAAPGLPQSRTCAH